MFRTVFITKGQYLTVKDEWLLINYGDTVKKVPLSDIKNLFFHNQTISYAFLSSFCVAFFNSSRILESSSAGTLVYSESS